LFLVSSLLIEQWEFDVFVVGVCVCRLEIIEGPSDIILWRRPELEKKIEEGSGITRISLHTELVSVPGVGKIALLP